MPEINKIVDRRRKENDERWNEGKRERKKIRGKTLVNDRKEREEERKRKERITGTNVKINRRKRKYE